MGKCTNMVTLYTELGWLGTLGSSCKLEMSSMAKYTENEQVS